MHFKTSCASLCLDYDELWWRCSRFGCPNHKVLMKTKSYSHINLLSEFMIIYPYTWLNYLGIIEETYMKLLSLVIPLIKKDTIMRTETTPHERSTRRFLATGRSYEDLKYSNYSELYSTRHVYKWWVHSQLSLVCARSVSFAKASYTRYSKLIQKDWSSKLVKFAWTSVATFIFQRACFCS